MNGEPLPHRVRVRISPRPARSYDVAIGVGGPASVAEWLYNNYDGWRLAIVAEDRTSEIASLILGSAKERGLAGAVFRFGGGEERKTRTQKKEIENEMLASGYGRDTVVIAAGGGVTCDLAGFLAATYYRGVPWVAYPTTLLAMVDAAIGGKVAVNTPHGKNLIGAYHHPEWVRCDPSHLSTLPEREIRSGLAEVAKAALLESEVRVARLRELAPSILSGERAALEEIIEAAIRTKVEVVTQDDREEDYRQVLNLGHTIGHAIESASGFELRHGEAMSIGIALETRLAVAAGFAPTALIRQVEALLEDLGVPISLPEGLDPQSVHKRLQHDKKVREGRVRFSLLESPGKPHLGPEGWAVPVEDSLVRGVLGLNRQPVE
jgi:3-dehydroquinate synthase